MQMSILLRVDFCGGQTVRRNGMSALLRQQAEKEKKIEGRLNTIRNL
jgi:hypothetical protein